MNIMTTFIHVHRFEPAAVAGRTPLVLLHGTGGSEHDLVDLGRTIAPGAALLAPRGNVLENGMPRFFRRIQEGVFDHDDVRRRADELADFLGEARASYGIAAPIAVGFSNGANMAAALLMRRPEALAGAVLIRAMVPLPDRPVAGVDGKPVLILSGTLDPIVPAENSDRLAAMLHGAGAVVEHRRLAAGHGLTRADVDLATSWIAAQAAGD